MPISSARFQIPREMRTKEAHAHPRAWIRACGWVGNEIRVFATFSLEASAPGTSVFFFSFGFPLWRLVGNCTWKEWLRCGVVLRLDVFSGRQESSQKTHQQMEKQTSKPVRCCQSLVLNKEVGEIATPTSSQQLSPELAEP